MSFFFLCYDVQIIHFDSSISFSFFSLYLNCTQVFKEMKDWKRAVEVLDKMDQEGIQKNENTFHPAISACGKSGNWKMAIQLFERMQKDGIQRTVFVYNAVISACEKV